MTVSLCCPRNEKEELPGRTVLGIQADSGTVQPQGPVPSRCSWALPPPYWYQRYWRSASQLSRKLGSECHPGQRAPSSGVLWWQAYHQGDSSVPIKLQIFICSDQWHRSARDHLNQWHHIFWISYYYVINKPLWRQSQTAESPSFPVASCSKADELPEWCHYPKGTTWTGEEMKNTWNHGWICQKRYTKSYSQ